MGANTVQEEQDRRDTGIVVERAKEVLAEHLARPLSPAIYLVATPIGNLADISLRALSVLCRTDLIAAEDTRHSRKLLSHFGIKAELTPYHEHNAAKERPKLLSRVRAGQAVAIISDAGTPLISDPGYKLVREALEQGLAVVSIPGPSAVLAGLTSAGLPTDTFLFAGFLPPKSGPRRARLEELKDIPATLVFFETASRLGKALGDMAEVFGGREAAIAKELTKLHESLSRGRLDALADSIGSVEDIRGEFVLLVAPPTQDERQASDSDILAALERALSEESFRDAVRSVSDRLGARKSHVYELGLTLTRAKT